MKKFLGSIAALVAIVASSSADAESAREFRLGFKSLADQIPSVVGEPIEDEHHGVNGDSLQQTTKGLMVWRKADNWTAFTNGSKTWINGPQGAQERANDQRFAWEGGEAPAAPPKSEPAHVGTSLDILSVTSPVRPGDEVTLSASTIPGLNAIFAVHGPSGIAWPLGKDPKGSDCSGLLVWTWTLDPGAAPGEWKIVVTADPAGKPVSNEVAFTVSGR